MEHPRLSPQEAQQLILIDGYCYLDVRSEQEFALGHAAGAYNIPLKTAVGQGMLDNPDFLSVVRASFPSSQPLVVGCRSGARSRVAAALLVAAGFTRIVEQRAGQAGVRDAFGQLVEAGWQDAGLPVSTEALPGRDYAALRQRGG